MTYFKKVSQALTYKRVDAALSVLIRLRRALKPSELTLQEALGSSSSVAQMPKAEAQELTEEGVPSNDLI